MIIRAAVTHSDLKTLQKPFAIISHAYQHNHWCYGLENFSRYYVTIKKLTVQTIYESDQNWENSEQFFE